MSPRADRLPLRLLLNAEPFGYGPAAAIAVFFPLLRPHFEVIGYAGKRHTLDLQRALPYDALHDISGAAREERAEALAPIFSRYDLFFTAMDHKMAQLAKSAGLPVYYYDALAWYWPEIPASARQSELYLAQDFFGVKERLASVFGGAGNAHLVPPIVPSRIAARAREHVLINLGGLQNPHWPLEGVVAYARSVLAALRRAIPASERILIAASEAVTRQLDDDGVRSYSRSEMEQLIAGAKAAFMTPGLANLYDAAAFDLKTIWLPPANDSQGQQLRLLEAHGMRDASIDWHDLGYSTMDYAGEQGAVLSRISSAAQELAGSAAAQTRFAELASLHYQALSKDLGSKTAKLIDTFGSGGEQRVAALVLDSAARLAQSKVGHG
jgi:hypothetical protein